MNVINVIQKYYPEDNDLRRILLRHSTDVTRKALEVARRHPELPLNKQFLHDGAMLHDIGIFLTNAPAIFCMGTEPYLMHGKLGADLMRQEGLPDIARVCERHTGTGLTEEVIRAQNLPLPPGDYRPETLEEQVICYADKFFSKTHLDRERTVEQTIKSLQKYGQACVDQFEAWQKLFG